MKNTMQKYLFYLKQQNERAKKNVLQHTLTTKYRAIKPINKIEFKYKKDYQKRLPVSSQPVCKCGSVSLS